jgi:hypothetical protein
MHFLHVRLAMPLLFACLTSSASAEWVKDDQSLGSFIIINAVMNKRHAFYPLEKNRLVVPVTGEMVYEYSDGALNVVLRPITAEERKRYAKSPTLAQALKDEFLILYPAKERKLYEDIAIMANEWTHGIDLLLRCLSLLDQYHLDGLAERLEPRLNSPLTTSAAKTLVATLQQRMSENYPALIQSMEEVKMAHRLYLGLDVPLSDDISAKDRAYVGQIAGRLESYCGQNRSTCVSK